MLGGLLRRGTEAHRAEQQADAVARDLRAVGLGQAGELVGQRGAADDEPDAGVGRGGLWREHRADRGGDAVRADEQVGGGRVAAGEPGLDLAVGHHVVAGQRGIGVHGQARQQQVSQHLPVDHDAGPARAEPADLVQLRVQDQLFGRGVHDDLAQQRVPARRQAVAHRLETGLAQHEPVALEPCDDPRVALEHVGLDPGTTQTLRESQTSQTGSDNGNSHHTPPDIDANLVRPYDLSSI